MNNFSNSKVVAQAYSDEKCNDYGCRVEEASQLEQKFGSIEKALSVQCDVISKLTEKLYPVMELDSPENDCEKCCGYSVTSPVIQKLQDFEEGIASRTYRLNNIISRLPL